MIYEFRTYDLKPRSVPEFEKRSAEKIKEGRLDHSDLFGFWYTEAGPLNQVVHVWPYEDLNQRGDVRARVVEEGVWPPDNSEFVVNMRSEIFLPAPFMQNRGEAKLGPVYEMRIYTYNPGDIPQVIDKWSEYIEEREKYSPLVGAWYSEIGALNTWIHMWASHVGVRELRSPDAGARRDPRERRLASSRRSRSAQSGEQADAADEFFALAVASLRSEKTHNGRRYAWRGLGSCSIRPGVECYLYGACFSATEQGECYGVARVLRSSDT